jgi:hypothetical protein
VVGIDVHQVGRLVRFAHILMALADFRYWPPSDLSWGSRCVAMTSNPILTWARSESALRVAISVTQMSND